MKKKEKAKILSEAEFNQLLTVTKVGKFAIRNVAILYCSFGLGLPAKEIASLTIDDVADAQYELLDKICLYRKHKKQYYLYLTNKKVHNALADHLMNMKDMGRNKPFFQTQRRKEFRPDVLQKLFRKLYDDAGIFDASSHSGRQTFITRLIEHGVSIKMVSQLAGHANIATTTLYCAENDNSDSLQNIVDLAVF